MKISDVAWCANGSCPCPVRLFVKYKTACFSMEEAAKEMNEKPKKVQLCLHNLEMQDVVCRDKDLWCPDNPV